MKRVNQLALAVFVLVAVASAVFVSGCSRNGVDSVEQIADEFGKPLTYEQMVLDASADFDNLTGAVELHVESAYIRISRGGVLTNRCYQRHHSRGMFFYRVPCKKD